MVKAIYKTTKILKVEKLLKFHVYIIGNAYVFLFIHTYTLYRKLVKYDIVIIKHNATI